MNKLLTILIITLFFSCNRLNEQKCSIPETLRNEIEKATTKKDLDEEDFGRINGMLPEYQIKGNLSTLINCDCYTQNIESLFNSEDSEKRVTAYLLIGMAQDSTFNTKLIEKIKSDESSLLKTWGSIALMANESSAASDNLFKLFSSYPEGLPVHTLINMYIKYDTFSVKKTCWKYIDSENRNEQVTAIQCLSSLGQDKALQKRLVEFLGTWDVESKGWVISAMSIQKMSNLKIILKRYSDNEDLKEVVIRALKNSPTKMDNEFAEELEKNDK